MFGRLIELAQLQIAWQLDAYDSLDTKAGGLLAFIGALVAGILLLKPEANAYLIWATYCLGISAILCVLTLFAGRMDIGPSTRALYQAARSSPRLRQTPTRAVQRALDHAIITQLNRTIGYNARPLERKQLSWRVAGVFILASIVLMVAGVTMRTGGKPHVRISASPYSTASHSTPQQ